tara:strand:+ start:131 stop:325 length:195 start_codon:yes stop_codon:yes gene_type:complete
MNEDEIKTQVDTLQTELNRIIRELVQASPIAQNTLGQITALNKLINSQNGHVEVTTNEVVEEVS